MTSESAPFVQATQIDLEYPAAVVLLARTFKVEIEISEDQEKDPLGQLPASWSVHAVMPQLA